MSVAQVAERLGFSAKTVHRWCESGKLPAITKAYGKKTTYLINIATLTFILKQQEEINSQKLTKPHRPKDHAEFVQPWIKAMEKGLITGRPFSPITIKDYVYYLTYFLQVYKAVSMQTVQSALVNTPIHQYGKRFKLYKAIVCFAKFLIKEGELEASFLKEVAPLFPKRHTPPKRPCVNSDQIQCVLEITQTPLERLIVILLASTGLRVSEAVRLRRDDIDLKQQVLTVHLGKGNKTRAIGLSFQVLEALTNQMEAVPSEWVLSDEQGNPLSRMALYHRLRHLGNKAGVKVTPHALRRAFVTINANKGRPLHMLQRACGHSDIKTTMSYCLTTEQEVIEAMKEW